METGEIRRSVIDYMNRRKRFAFIQGTHVAKDLELGDHENKKKVKRALALLERSGALKKRTMHIKNYSVTTYARVASKIDEGVLLEVDPPSCRQMTRANRDGA